MAFDKRLTPARPDLAAAHLKGQVEAAKFVQGRRQRVARGRAALHAAPQTSAARETELLFGEIFTVYEEKDCWSWGQAQSDSYVGYVHSSLLDAEEKPRRACHCAGGRRSCRGATSSWCCTTCCRWGAQVRIAGRKNGFAELSGGGHVYEKHLAPMGEYAPDFVAVAQRFVGVPYVWAGKTLAGLDCSGLIQTALAAAGTIGAPRHRHDGGGAGAQGFPRRAAAGGSGVLERPYGRDAGCRKAAACQCLPHAGGD